MAHDLAHDIAREAATPLPTPPDVSNQPGWVQAVVYAAFAIIGIVFLIARYFPPRTPPAAPPPVDRDQGGEARPGSVSQQVDASLDGMTRVMAKLEEWLDEANDALAALRLELAAEQRGRLEEERGRLDAEARLQTALQRLEVAQQQVNQLRFQIDALYRAAPPPPRLNPYDDPQLGPGGGPR